jgi:hypothetical protein
MSDWKIAKAEKIKRKDKTKAGDHSHWLITWQHPDHGELALVYAVESAPSYRKSRTIDKSYERAQRYAAVGKASRVGAKGVVKDLYLLDKAEQQKAAKFALPDLVIKSPHKSSESESVVKTAGFYRRVGRVAYASKRQRQSSNAELSVLIMERLPGADVVDTYTAACDLWEKNRDFSAFPTLTWQRLQVFAGELLAQLELIYTLNGGQGVFDIKVENLLCEMNDKYQITRFFWLDVDSAFEKRLTFTFNTLAPKTAMALWSHYNHKTRPSIEESQRVDRRVCARLLKRLAYFFWPRDQECPIIDEKSTASFIWGNEHLSYIYNEANLPIVVEFKKMITAIEKGDKEALPEPVKSAWLAERARIECLSARVGESSAATTAATATTSTAMSEGRSGAGVGAGACNVTPTCR